MRGTFIRLQHNQHVLGEGWLTGSSTKHQPNRSRNQLQTGSFFLKKKKRKERFLFMCELNKVFKLQTHKHSSHRTRAEKPDPDFLITNLLFNSNVRQRTCGGQMDRGEPTARRTTEQNSEVQITTQREPDVIHPLIRTSSPLNK